MNADKAARIRALNDLLRCRGLNGGILVTQGIHSLGEAQVHRIMAAVQAFDRFDQDNDPHEEHDCAVLSVDEHRVIFKIDYYNLGLDGHSDDPADPRITRRVMTVMLADEY